MKGYDVYQHYIAIKSHFSDNSYNYFRYNGKIKTSYQAYDRRNDKRFFELVGQKIRTKEVVPFLVANFVHNDDLWIGNLIENYDDAHQVFVSWKKRMNHLYQNYEEDLTNIVEFIAEKEIDIKDVFCYNDGHPLIFKFLVQEMIEKETFIMLDDVIHFLPLLDKKIHDIVWKSEIGRINKYRRFITYDDTKVSDITRYILLPQ